MSTFTRRESFLLLIVVSTLLIVITAVGRARPALGLGDASAANSSIKICVSNEQLVQEYVSFSGDLGTFALIYPTDPCHTTGELDAGSYTIVEALPTGWFPWGEPQCRETAGTGASQWQTTPQSVTIDLAADATVECSFASLDNPDEPNDTLEQATSITYGARIIAAIGPHDGVGYDEDKDFYRFQGYAGDIIQVGGDVYSFPDPWLLLRDASGSILEHSNPQGPSLYLEYLLPDTGEYYLEMRGSCAEDDSCTYGPYGLDLALVDPFEPNESLETAAPINFGELLRGNFNNWHGNPFPEDFDYFRFEGQAGDEVVIVVSAFSNDLFPDCELLDENGVTLASQFGASCRIEHSLAAGGLYFIKTYAQFREGVSNWSGPYSVALANQDTIATAVDDDYAMYAGEPLVVAAPGVLENDSDPQDDGLTAILSADVQHGTLDLQPDGSFTYTPDAAYAGPDSFQYQAFDGTVNSAAATVTLQVKWWRQFLPVTRAN